MPKVALLCLLMAQSNIVFSKDMNGTVCLGNNLAKPYDEHTDRLYLKIDDSAPIYFMHPYTGPRVVAQNLDTYRDHVISVIFDNQVVQSWKLNFSKLKTESVLVWRGAGSWRMELNDSSSCK